MENSQWGLVACFGLVWGSSPGHPPPLAPLAPPLLSIASQRPKGQNPENPGFSRPLTAGKPNRRWNAGVWGRVDGVTVLLRRLEGDPTIPHFHEVLLVLALPRIIPFPVG